MVWAQTGAFMSRFSNLEFSGQENQRETQSQEIVKDEAYYLADARSQFELGEFEHALRSFARVLEHNPDNTMAWSGQVRMLIELGEFKEAKLWADKALERFPKDAELLAAKAVALGRIGDVDTALAFSDASFEERGDSAYLWLARADIFMARKEKQAEYCFQKALLMSTRDWVVHWLAARIYIVYQKFAAALKLINQAMSLDASQSVLWLELGLCQQALGMPQARQAFSRTLELNPDNRRAQQVLLHLREPGLWDRLQGWWRRES
jgi:tetratricopeptide (TPR) repeat protein